MVVVLEGVHGPGGGRRGIARGEQHLVTGTRGSSRHPRAPSRPRCTRRSRCGSSSSCSWTCSTGSTTVAVEPAGPWGPVRPCGPWGPWGPVAPSSPSVPSSPSAPFWPAAPCGPAGPCGPVAPSAPAGPCGPIGPSAPFRPSIPFDTVLYLHVQTVRSRSDRRSSRPDRRPVHTVDPVQTVDPFRPSIPFRPSTTVQTVDPRESWRALGTCRAGRSRHAGRSHRSGRTLRAPHVPRHGCLVGPAPARVGDDAHRAGLLVDASLDLLRSSRTRRSAHEERCREHREQDHECEAPEHLTSLLLHVCLLEIRSADARRAPVSSELRSVTRGTD